MVVIFTDLDGSLLHRDTFKFDSIKDYIKSLINSGIIIIPNSSKTEKEIEKFNEELGIKLPYISENGSAIHGLNLINHNFPNEIILSRKKEELLKIFNEKTPEKLLNKCVQISKLSKKEQEKIFGQKDDRLKDALKRKYTLPFLFNGNNSEKNKLLKSLSNNSLTLQEGGRVLNLCDNINKIKSMNRVIKILKKTEDKIKTIAADLKVRGAVDVTTYSTDLNDIEDHNKFIDIADLKLNGIDIVLIAHGTLSNQKSCQKI